MAYYLGSGRPLEYSIEGFIRLLVLQKVLGVPTDSLILYFLSLGVELREFCGFINVLNAPMVMRFRQNFVGYLKAMFDKLVDITEQICREIYNIYIDYFIYDSLVFYLCHIPTLLYIILAYNFVFNVQFIYIVVNKL